MEMNFKEAFGFFLQCVGAGAIVATIFGWILYKLIDKNYVAKEPEEPRKEEPQFIDELYQQ